MGLEGLREHTYTSVVSVLAFKLSSLPDLSQSKATEDGFSTNSSSLPQSKASEDEFLLNPSLVAF